MIIGANLRSHLHWEAFSQEMWWASSVYPPRQTTTHDLSMRVTFSVDEIFMFLVRLRFLCNWFFHHWGLSLCLIFPPLTSIAVIPYTNWSLAAQMPAIVCSQCPAAQRPCSPEVESLIHDNSFDKMRIGMATQWCSMDPCHQDNASTPCGLLGFLL